MLKYDEQYSIKSSLELGMYPLETSRDMRKLKWEYNVRNMPKRRQS